LDNIIRGFLQIAEIIRQKDGFRFFAKDEVSQSFADKHFNNAAHIKAGHHKRWKWRFDYHVTD